MSSLSVDDPEWSKPPKENTVDDPLYVDFRFDINQITNVDTVAGTADVKISVVYYWTDDRLSDKKEIAPETKELLWTPRFEWFNARLITECVYPPPFLTGHGRLKMCVEFTGTVENPMHLEDFPFDVDDIMIEFRTGHSFRIGESNRFTPTGSLFVARPIQEQGEGTWVDPVFQGKKVDGKIAEWVIRGISTRIEYREPNLQGQQTTVVDLGAHVTRNAGFYFWKALVPLYFLMILSFGTFEYDVDNLDARGGMVSTYFLAAFAMLYVVGEALPKTDFLTKIDKVIVLTTFWLVLIGIASFVTNHIAKGDGDGAERNTTSIERAETLDLWIEITLAVIYVVANVVIFVPAWMKQRREVQLLTQDDPDDEETPAGAKTIEFDAGDDEDTVTNIPGESGSPIWRPRVHKGATYVTWKKLKAKAGYLQAKGGVCGECGWPLSPRAGAPQQRCCCGGL